MTVPQEEDIVAFNCRFASGETCADLITYSICDSNIDPCVTPTGLGISGDKITAVTTEHQDYFSFYLRAEKSTDGTLFAYSDIISSYIIDRPTIEMPTQTSLHEVVYEVGRDTFNLNIAEVCTCPTE